MSNEIFDNVTDLAETALDNYKKVSESVLEVTEQLLQEQIDLTTSLFEATKSNANRSASTKDAATLVANQAELGQELAQQILKTSQSCAAILTEAGKFYQNMIESSVKTANANISKAGKVASSSGKKGKAA